MKTKQLDFYCNFILFNSINKILILFNRSISCVIFYTFTWEKYKKVFKINYNTLEKTKDKRIFRVINQKTLFKYYYDKKATI